MSATTKKTSKETSSKKAVAWKSKVSNTTKTVKESTTKKVVVKRRKLDLAPTRASAVAIASQANRAKKKALVEKLSSKGQVVTQWKKVSSTMIPLWVWAFFWFSLLLFCVSFYQAIIRPQIEEELTEANSGNYSVDSQNSISLWWNWNDILWTDAENNGGWLSDTQEFNPLTPKTAVEIIEEYFRRISGKQFDSALELFTPWLQRSSEIKEHFTSFRLNPFVSWIEWWLVPTNVKYVSTTTYWKDKYSFDLSYVLSSNQEKYDETWEFVVDTTWDEPKIASIVCTTTGCSRHPIFWPESFGLMR